jgi:hypothetical protein
MQIPPESEPPEGSEDAESAEEPGTRERDLMRELDQVTGRRVGGETKETPEEVVEE